MIAHSPSGRIFRAFLLFSVILLFSPVLSGAGPKTAPVYKEGEVLVKFKKGFDLAATEGVAYDHGAAVVNTFPFLSGKKGQAYLHLRSDRFSTEELLAQLANDPRVESVSPNYAVIATATYPFDSFFGQLWGLHNTGQKVNGVFGTAGADISVPLAWDISTGDPSVVVAVVDTGVDFSHEDLSANMWVNPGEIPGNGIDDDYNGYIDDVHGINAIDVTSPGSRGNPSDDHGHGTHCAGIIAGVGNNGKGITGVNWQTKIMAVKFMDASGHGWTADSITATEYVIDMKLNHGVNVVAINASYVSVESGPAAYLQIQKDAIEAAGDAGIVFVAAAGNESVDNDNADISKYPAAYDSPNIIAVAATDQNDNLADFSSYGPVSVDLAAPGVNILSTLPGIVMVPGTEPFLDNMEAGESKWVHGGPTDTWALTASAFHNGTFSWTDSPAGDYSDNANSYLSVANDIDLSTHPAGEDLRLRFWANVALETNADFLYVEISKDGGANFDKTLDAITGPNAAWSLYSYQIPADYRFSQFRFRFHLVTDGSNVLDGVYIDDAGIANNFGAGSNYYDYWDGTSMAAPYVTGAVALVSALHPTDSVTEKKNRILAGVDHLAGLEGLVATAGRLNLNNILNSTCKISGTITTTEAGNPALPGVLVKLVDLTLPDTVLTDTVMSDITNASGQYSLFGQKTSKYKVVPELAGYKFSPVYYVIDSLTTDTILDFRAGEKVYALSGAVITAGPETINGLDGVDLTLSDTYLIFTVRTGDNGLFSLAEVLPGSYNLKPAKFGWIFEPASRNLTVVDNDIPDRNFTAYLKITLTSPDEKPYGTPNEVLKGGEVNCTIGATNILDNPISYLWTAEAGHFLNEDLITSSGTTSNLRNPVWVADISMLSLLEYTFVQISVEVSCEDGYTRHASFLERVDQTSEQPPTGGSGGGGGAVGPLALGISALLGWWKRRRL